MNQSFVIFSLIFLWSASNAYNIMRLSNKPPPAKYGFNPSMGEQDEIGLFKSFCVILSKILNRKKRNFIRKIYAK